MTFYVVQNITQWKFTYIFKSLYCAVFKYMTLNRAVGASVALISKDRMAAMLVIHFR